MRVAAMGENSRRRKLDGDHRDRSPDQRCQRPTRDHAVD
jgi:hypothetical protein